MTWSDFAVLASIGLAAGAFSGMFGIGGGVVMVPALIYFMGVTQQTAQGTSLGVLVVPVAIVAAYNYYKSGNLEPKWAGIIAIGFMVGGYFGSKISLGLSDLMLKRIFGVLLLFLAIRMIFFTKGNPT